MLLRELDQLVRRAQAAGHPDIPTYCLSLERALQEIAGAESGVWGQVAATALKGRTEGGNR
jgi:hypothetical protein